MSFAEQVVCITGAGRGLGYAMAERFAAEGARVVILEKDPATGAAAAARLGATFLALDVSDAAAVAAAVAAIDAQFGRIDVWINNAGIAHKGLAVELTPTDWDADLGVMLSGAFYCANAVGKVFLRQGRGNLINIASVNGLFAQKGRAPYCAAKAGLIMLTKVLASEWGEHGIRVNAIAPASTLTPTRKSLTDPARRDAFLSRIPLGRFGTPEEMAAAALYLAGPEAGFITGHTLVLDGGLTAG